MTGASRHGLGLTTGCGRSKLDVVFGSGLLLASHAGMLLYESSLESELLFGRQRDVFHSAFHILARTRPPYVRTLRSSFTRDSERLTVGTSRLPRFWADHFQGHGTRKIICLSMSDAPYAMRAKSFYESKPEESCAQHQLDDSLCSV